MSETNPGQKLCASKRINAYNMLATFAKSIQNKTPQISTKNSNRSQVKNKQPKTRFTRQDRSSQLQIVPSPRLKYFPAEEIRKSRPTRSCEFISNKTQNNEKPAEQSLSVKNLSTARIENNNNDNKNNNNNKASSPQQQAQEQPANLSSTESSNKLLYFTPAMIHDQELLVTTLRQQGIHPDIMKRQFDSLLNEQRKQLFYLDQLQSREIDNQLDSKSKASLQRKRISRIDDGKPEWMARITPPWISYAVLDNAVNNANSQVHETTHQGDQHYESRQQQESIDHFQHRNTNMLPTRRVMFDQGNEQMMHQPETKLCQSQSYQQHPETSRNPYHFHYPITNTDNTSASIPINGYSQFHHDGDNHSGAYPTHNNNQIMFQQGNELKCQQNNNFQDNSGENELASSQKLRVYNEVTKKQNNGLQDPETIKLAMENLKNPEHQKGLEYIEKLNRKETNVKLNGVQNPEETYHAHQQHLNFVECKTNTKICANGLENTRNFNNPTPPIILQKNLNEPVYTEYPRRKINSVILPAERENETVPNSLIKNNNNEINNYNYNRTFPAFVEPRVIGGIQYFARKPAYIPNTSMHQ